MTAWRAKRNAPWHAVVGGPTRGAMLRVSWLAVFAVVFAVSCVGAQVGQEPQARLTIAMDPPVLPEPLDAGAHVVPVAVGLELGPVACARSGEIRVRLVAHHEAGDGRGIAFTVEPEVRLPVGVNVHPSDSLRRDGTANATLHVEPSARGEHAFRVEGQYEGELPFGCATTGTMPPATGEAWLNITAPEAPVAGPGATTQGEGATATTAPRDGERKAPGIPLAGAVLGVGAVALVQRVRGASPRRP